MKITNQAATVLLLLAGLNPPTLAWASGQHAGEHVHEPAVIGKPGVQKQINRTVNVEMTDAMRFVPSEVAVQKGETIHFIVRNSGKLRHEFVLGSEKELKEHAELMKKFPSMQHEESNMVSVEPGQSGNVIWQFTRAGKVPFACLQAGHFDAGMKGLVTVAAGKAR
jgi:uncharacterized cupredoxin-like copper-binding protein